ncbi:MAG: hypothetical protein AB1593_11375 [Pseudomonadota bacterium]
MIEPVALADFFTVFFTAALVILCGGLYALLFAYARVKNAPRLMPLAYLSYAGLAVSALMLARAANLFDSGFWSVVVVLMLVGYLVAPHGIWHLCVGTHSEEDHDASESEPPRLVQP